MSSIMETKEDEDVILSHQIYNVFSMPNSDNVRFEFFNTEKAVCMYAQEFQRMEEEKENFITELTNLATKLKSQNIFSGTMSEVMLTPRSVKKHGRFKRPAPTPCSSTTNKIVIQPSFINDTTINTSNTRTRKPARKLFKAGSAVKPQRTIVNETVNKGDYQDLMTELSIDQENASNSFKQKEKNQPKKLPAKSLFADKNSIAPLQSGASTSTSRLNTSNNAANTTRVTRAQARRNATEHTATPSGKTTVGVNTSLGTPKRGALVNQTKDINGSNTRLYTPTIPARQRKEEEEKKKQILINSADKTKRAMEKKQALLLNRQASLREAEKLRLKKLEEFKKREFEKEEVKRKNLLVKAGEKLNTPLKKVPPPVRLAPPMNLPNETVQANRDLQKRRRWNERLKTKNKKAETFIHNSNANESNQKGKLTKQPPSVANDTKNITVKEKTNTDVPEYCFQNHPKFVDIDAALMTDDEDHPTNNVKGKVIEEEKENKQDDVETSSSAMYSTLQNPPPIFGPKSSFMEVKPTGNKAIFSTIFSPIADPVNDKQIKLSQDNFTLQVSTMQNDITMQQVVNSTFNVNMQNNQEIIFAPADGVTFSAQHEATFATSVTTTSSSLMPPPVFIPKTPVNSKTITMLKDGDISNYQMTPPPPPPDYSTYEISQLIDSDEEEEHIQQRVHKKIPRWAMRREFVHALRKQFTMPREALEELLARDFGNYPPIIPVPVEQMGIDIRVEYRLRSSSVNWHKL